MPDQDYSTTLIRTKLNRPPLPVDMVKRPRLTRWLNQRLELPLTLVSAPAGYGKSTLISCWLESVGCPAAWVSLDEHDNIIGNFLNYFIAAIHTIFPNAVPKTQDFLLVTPQPSISAIARTLINELDQVEERFIIVLDDYHLIETQNIHELLNELLLHPPCNLHLVLGTRMDPPLPLVNLRANSQMAEIRVPDLRFNQEETSLLMKKMIGVPVDRATLIEIDTNTEGWVTGLRLAALAMRHRIKSEDFPGELSVNNRYVTEYLIAEILAKQAASLSECMLKTSILERFCADLCELFCYQDSELSGNRSRKHELNGIQFVDWLRSSNLFVIPLDDQQEWFRYHYLFRDFLHQELLKKLNPDEIAKLHATAGRWYAHNGWIEEALYHLLAASDLVAAIKLIGENRYRLMNSTQWPRLDGWLNLFPEEVIENTPELWMLKIWLAYHSGQWTEIPRFIAHLDSILAGGTDTEITQRLAGEISSLYGFVAYHSGDFEKTISHSRRALELIPPELWIVRAFARMNLGGGLLLKGDVVSSYQAFYGGLETEKEQSKPFKATVLTLACYFHWIIADLKGLEQASKQAAALCLEADYRQILGISRYHLGCVHYQQNDLSAAEELFAWVVERPYQNYGTCYIASACGLGMTYQAQGKEAEASQVVEDAIAFLFETGNISQLPMILALQAEIAFRQGHLSGADQWATKLDSDPPLAPMPWFLAPHLTLVKVWLAENTPASLEKAAELLAKLHDYLEDIHNIRFLIETLALRSVLAQTLGDHPTALAYLEKSLRLAHPGGFIRVFVDLGYPMKILLSQLKLDNEQGAYINQIRSAFPGTQRGSYVLNQDEILEPLTNRELQVLELLRLRLTNKEIATKLVISPGTVKGHTINIYQKLDVNNRRMAVEKAVALGLISPV